jgi:polyhydroxyalkanoate synthesis repressor PhaR
MQSKPIASSFEGKSAVPTSKSNGAKPALRVVKKYPNRRLYDTNSSTYITLADVKRLVMTGEPFVVRDAKTNEDLTRAILLQIILEEEAGGAPIFTEAALSNIIRFYGHAMQGFMGSCLEENVQSMMDIQNKLTEQAKGTSPEMWAPFLNLQSPMMQNMVGGYAENSRNAFLKMQEQMQKQAGQMLGVFGLKP